MHVFFGRVEVESALMADCDRLTGCDGHGSFKHVEK